jgi:hypothetical protein
MSLYTAGVRPHARVYRSFMVHVEIRALALEYSIRDFFGAQRIVGFSGNSDEEFISD